jgi:hypothetical protein
MELKVPLVRIEGYCSFADAGIESAQGLI